VYASVHLCVLVCARFARLCVRAWAGVRVGGVCVWLELCGWGCGWDVCTRARARSRVCVLGVCERVRVAGVVWVGALAPLSLSPHNNFRITLVISGCE
jgi:hypothetical protein